MTSGERAIWAAAFVSDLRAQVESGYVTRDAHVKAATAATRVVTEARCALAVIDSLQVEKGWEKLRADTRDMLEDMLADEETP